MRSTSRLRRLWQQVAARLMSVTLIASLAGCSSLRPQIISRDLVLGADAAAIERQGCTADPTFHGSLPIAICQANQLQLRYLEAVVDESTLHNLIGAGLIILSATGLYKGITSSGDSTQRLLAKMGLTAAAAYAYGENFISVPRQRLYLAGADALACAVLASRPFLYTSAEIGQVGSSNAATLYGALATFARDLRHLEEVVDQTRAALKERKVPEQKCSRRAAAVAPGTHPQDAARLRSTEQREAAASERLCRQQHEDKHGEQIAGDRLVEGALQDADLLLSRARVMLGKGSELLASIDLAAAQVTATANRIQRQVAEEVTKTQPNLAVLFQGGGALRANASRFSGSGLLAPAAAGTVQGQAGAFRPSAPASTELDDLRTATQQLLASADLLQIWLSRADSLARQVGSLSTCIFNSAAGQAALTITPNVHEVTMRKGSSMVWEVSGVSGAPRATLVGDSPGALASQAEVAVSAREGMQLVTLTLKGDIGEGQDLRLLISDATGGARREVSILRPTAESPKVKSDPADSGKTLMTKDEILQLCGLHDAGKTEACVNGGRMQEVFKTCINNRLGGKGEPRLNNPELVQALRPGGVCHPRP